MWFIIMITLLMTHLNRNQAEYTNTYNIRPVMWFFMPYQTCVGLETILLFINIIAEWLQSISWLLYFRQTWTTIYKYFVYLGCLQPVDCLVMSQHTLIQIATVSKSVTYWWILTSHTCSFTFPSESMISILAKLQWSVKNLCKIGQ